MEGLQGRTAIVTGGGSGIGQAIAVKLGHEGANVAVNYVGEPGGAESTRQAIDEGVAGCIDEVNNCPGPGRAVLVRADVSDEDQVKAMFARARAELGPVDFLVNNAGIQSAQDSHRLAAADFDRVMAVNIRGAFLCAREHIAGLLEGGRPGAIVNVSSVHQVIPKPRFLSYALSKGAMGNLTTTLALEYAGRGIRVNGIGPGATVTPINRSWLDDPHKREQVTANIPIGRAGTAEEMAEVTAFLLSDGGAYICGQTIYVDGGLTLYADFRSTWSSE
ncbi:MAG: glucose 1-dehydrogenase [Actinomycetota bacterium]